MRAGSEELATDATIDKLLDGFEKSWQSGTIPDICDVCRHIDERHRPAALIDLVKIDLEYRWRVNADHKGTDPATTRHTLEWYVEKLGAEVPLQDLAPELIRHEYYVRQRWGDRPTIAEYQQRFSLSKDHVEGLLGDVAKSVRHQENDTVAASTLATAQLEYEIPVIAGYEILHKLGQGGMGTVYKARQLEADRIVALKVIRADQLADLSPQQRQHVVTRFQAESRAAAALDHDHIVTVYEVGESNGRAFYSMRFVEGMSLSERLTQGPLTGRESAAMLEPIARAVQKTHDAGILHRDLKPSNILVEQSSGRPLVMDFGLAKLQDSDVAATKTGEVFGSPPYMAPEQVTSANEATAASDVYSLGATLYHLLIGKPPFQGTSVVETLRLVLETDPIAPRELNPAVDRDLETICLKCLQKEPTQRYGSAEAVADELARFLRMEPIVARPIGTVDRLARWCRRNPAVAGLLISVFVILITASGVSTYFAVDASNQAEQANDATVEAQQQLAAVELVNADLVEQGKITRRYIDWVKTLSGGRSVTVSDRAKRRSLEYAKKIKAARTAIQAKDHRKAVSLLESTMVGQRGWEFEYLLRRANSVRDPERLNTAGLDRVVIKANSRGIAAVAFHPDQLSLATASTDHTIKVWDANTGKQQSRLEGHHDAVTDIVFHPDGQHLVSSSQDRTVRVWDLASGRELSKRDVGSAVVDIDVSRDGSDVLAISADGRIRYWPVLRQAAINVIKRHRGHRAVFNASGSELLVGETDGAVSDILSFDREPMRVPLRVPLGNHSKNAVRCLAISSDGRRMVSGSTGKTKNAMLWHVGGLWNTSSIASLAGHSATVTATAFSPDGRRAVTASEDSSIRIWDAGTGQLLFELHRPHATTSVAFSADGSRIAAGSVDGTVCIWNAARRQTVQSLDGHLSPVTLVAVSRDSRRIVSVSEDNVLRVWDAGTGRGLWSHKRPESISFVTFSADNRHIVVGTRVGTVEIWSVDGGVHRYQGYRQPQAQAIRAAALTLSGVLITAHARGWQRTEAQTGRATSRVPIRIRATVRISSTGRFVAVGSRAKRRPRSVSMHDALSGKLIRRFEGKPVVVSKIVLSGDNSRVGALCSDGRILVWNGRTGKRICAISAIGANDIAMPSNGRSIVASLESGIVRIWDVQSGRLRQEVRRHKGAVNCVAIGNGTGWIVTGGQDRALKIWSSGLQPAEQGHK